MTQPESWLYIREMIKKVGFALLVVLAVSACSKPTPNDSTPAATTIATTPVQQRGWGSVPPTQADIDQMAGWWSRSNSTVLSVLNADAMSGLDQAIGDHDVSRVKRYCRDVTIPIVIELPAVQQTPDPDLTKALADVVTRGQDLAASCEALEDPPTTDQLDVLAKSLEGMGSALSPAGSIMKRDGRILSNTGQ